MDSPGELSRDQVEGTIVNASVKLYFHIKVAFSNEPFLFSEFYIVCIYLKYLIPIRGNVTYFHFDSV